jgi:hypothetical protein
MFNSERFSRCFTEWVKAVGTKQGKQIAIDGKVMCGTQEKQLGREGLDMVTAFAVAAGFTLLRLCVKFIRC